MSKILSSKDGEVAISVADISKYFNPSGGNHSIKQLITSMFRSNNKREEGYWALKDINFEINKGEFFGIVGRNGSGKSTLLKMIAGVYTPSSGAIKVNGKLVPFIELGVGFNPELSGRDNVFLNGALLGFTRKEMLGMYDEIVSFAELSEHMEVKLKNFSSGMQVRLAFSIAIRAKSDILLIDEVLAVGDAAFQTKCFEYFSELKKARKTVVLVSHDRTALERFCDKGVLINNGSVIHTGTIKSVLKSYNEIILSEIQEQNTEKSALIKDVTVSISNISTQTGRFSTNKFEFGDPITFCFDAIFKKDADQPILGLTVWDSETVKPVLSTNTLITETLVGFVKKGSTLNFSVTTSAKLNDGKYSFEVAVANGSGTAMLAQSQRQNFYVTGSTNPYSTMNFDDPAMIEAKK